MNRLSIRVDFDDDAAFGPGKAKLLELVEREGSIRSAAAAMDMSYRRAWLLLESIKETFGKPAVDTATGGTKGGGAKLTKLGHALIALYRAVERNAARAVARDVSAMKRLRAGKPAKRVTSSARTSTRRH